MLGAEYLFFIAYCISYYNVFSYKCQGVCVQKLRYDLR
jgi:hypothetical protein